jgi:Leucine-rich repeat (LRR) protein
LKTIDDSFTFSATHEQKEMTTAISFKNSDRVVHLPRNLFEDFPELNYLLIRDSDIPILLYSLFGPEISELKRLEVNKCKIKIVEETAFDQLCNLERIWIYDNQIKSLPGKLFQNNHKLQWISFEYNKIKMIHPDIFKHLNQLEVVFLWANECTNDTIGCKECDSKLDHTELDQRLQPCFESYTKSLNLLNEGETDK